VTMRVHSWVEGEKHDMTIGKGEEGNKMDLYMVVDIEVHHIQVVGCKGCGVSWY
jgi:hypothetical protein